MKDNNSRKIFHLTSSHRALDNRIFYSELISLKVKGYECEVVGINDNEDNIICDVKIFGLSNRNSKFDSFLKRPLNILKKSFFSSSLLFHFHDPALIPVGIVLKLCGKKVVYDVHDDYEASIKDKFYKYPRIAGMASKTWWFFEWLASHFFDGIVVADRHLDQKFVWKAPVILGNYPRLNFIPAADASKEKTFNIIYVGGVSKDHGVDKVLDALELLPFDDICFHIIGDCQDAWLLNRIQTTSRVIYHGRIAWTDLHKYYTKAHIGVAIYQPLASFLYCPGENSVKIIEYMAAGIPVLCSNFPGLKKFVEDSQYGLTVQPDNPEAIAEKIKHLYENPLLCQKLGANGRRAFLNEYNWEKHESKLISLYEEILKIQSKKRSPELA